MTVITLGTWQNLLKLGPLYFEEKNFTTGVHNICYGTTRLDLIPTYLLKVLSGNHPMIDHEMLFYDLENKTLRNINRSYNNDYMLAASLTKKDRKTILDNIKTRPMNKQKPTLNFLATLLSLGEVVFSYDTKKGKRKTVCGTLDNYYIPNAKFSDGGMDGNGNLTYWDVEDKSWKTVQKFAQIEIDLDQLNEKVFTDKTKYLANNISTQLFAGIKKSTNPTIVATAPISKAVTLSDFTTFNNNSVNSNILLGLLDQKIVKFEYISSKGLRLAYGTTDSSRSLRVGSIDNSKRKDYLLYFDIIKNDIRTVKFTDKTLFKVIEVLDLPLKK